MPPSEDLDGMIQENVLLVIKMYGTLGQESSSSIWSSEQAILYLEELSIIFEKDRAIGQRAKDLADAAVEIFTDVMNSEEVRFIDSTGFESNLEIMCQASSKGIDKLADYFQFLAYDQELKKVYEAIAEIEDLELHESLMVKAGLLIARDSASLTYFFSLPQRLRKYHVLDVLGLGHG
ncbi:hypothetical protein COCNU_10G001540 [Cocos nucifera]|uniref:Uncharacterized protein n=1 Tax=Cocos nucifera TaxID=13894 RepID=A0A8K0IKW4_COCNU|nr:hypothetical protein COCNU_10G001540 [Cocos nucifera]